MSHINDVLKKAFENFLPSGWSVSGGAAHVQQPSDYSGTKTTFENADVVDTRVNPATQPTAGARVVSVGFVDMGSAVANILYVVFNATDDADAVTKLGSAATRSTVLIGERRTWTRLEGDEITRIDYLSDDAAPVGGLNLVTGEYVI